MWVLWDCAGMGVSVILVTRWRTDSRGMIRDLETRVISVLFEYFDYLYLFVFGGGSNIRGQYEGTDLVDQRWPFQRYNHPTSLQSILTSSHSTSTQIISFSSQRTKNPIYTLSYTNKTLPTLQYVVPQPTHRLLISPI